MNNSANEPKPEADASTANEPAEAQASQFARQANEAPPGLIAEFIDFLLHNKKWWLTPIILVMALLGMFVFMAQSAAGPFIYSLF